LLRLFSLQIRYENNDLNHSIINVLRLVEEALHTNVLISGLFFGGVPGQIIDWWLLDKVTLLVTVAIVAEYEDVLERLSAKYPSLQAKTLFHTVVHNATIVEPVEVSSAGCSDSDDVKFLACAIGGNANIIVSGDKHLLKINGWGNLEILTPREFTSRFIHMD